MPELVLLLFAPFLQIILSVLRILHRISLALIWIATICFLIGFVSAIVLVQLIANRHPVNTPCVDCGLVDIVFGFVGIIGNALATTIIALLAAAIYKKPKA